MLTRETLDEFLANDWQQNARLFKAAIDPDAGDINNDVLASLAENDLIESRLVNADGELILGPFETGDDPDDLLIETKHRCFATLLPGCQML